MEIVIGIEKRVKRVVELKSIVEVVKEIILCRVFFIRGVFDFYWKYKNFYFGIEYKGFYRVSDIFAILF